MSVYWFTGNTKSGKTTLARRLSQGQHNTVLLDGDALREVWPGLGLSKEDRQEQCLRVARLAQMLSEQGLNVVVAVIAPYEDLRRRIINICGCAFIYVKGGLDNSEETPYEEPILPCLTVQGLIND